MADAKISALTTLAQADVATATDFVPIVDTSVGATKKVTPDALVRKAMWSLDGDGNAVGLIGPRGETLGGVIDVRAFGAVGDGVADDTAAIQAAIDWAIYGASGSYTTNALLPLPPPAVVSFPRGTYRITDTLHVGYGTSYTTCILRGEGDRFYNGISADFNDRPAIAVQGVRRVLIRDLSIGGVNQQYMQSNAHEAVDRSDILNWIGPNLTANSYARYRPYAGIAIDPYGGAAPGNPYPAVTYPAFLGSVSQYNKLLSSSVIIDKCRIAGFVCGVVVQPGDTDANADFVSIADTALGENVIGVAYGNSQARLSHRRNVDFTSCHTGIDTVTFGRQIGNAAGLTTGCCFDRCYQWANVRMSYTHPMKFQECYSEGLYRLGSFSGIASGNSPIEFDGCKIGMQLLGASEFTPKKLMDISESQVTFRNSEFDADAGFMVIGGSMVTVDNCWVRNGSIFDEGTIGGKVAKTYSLGIWDGGGYIQRRMKVGRVRNPPFYNFAGNAITSDVAQTIDGDLFDIELFDNTPIPVWARRIGARGYGVPLEYGLTIVSSGITNIVKTGREFACRINTPFTFSSGIVPTGSIVYAQNSQQYYYIKSTSGFTSGYFDAVLVQLTDVRITEGAWVVKDGSELTSQNLQIFTANKFYPATVPVYAELTSGSPTITMRSMGGNAANATAVGVLVAGDVWDGGGNYGRAGSSIRATALDAAVDSVTAVSGEAAMTANARLSIMVEYPVFLKGAY